MAALLTTPAASQTPTDSFAILNTARIRTNATGMKVLAGWGALNAAAGTVGYFSADGGEAQRFHQMNALWGLTNFAIAGAGYLGSRRERTKTYTPAQALRKHRQTRRLFLLNAGLDGLYMGTGAYLVQRAANPSAGNPTLLRGYGKSLLLQGAGLLVFDAAMWAAHGRKEAQWYRLLEGVHITGGSVGMRISL